MRSIDQGRAYVSRLRQQQPFSNDALAEGTSDLVASVPLDVVDAVTENIQVRRDGNAEILRIEQEAAAEIQIIQESVTLSAMNRAAAIERVERQSALQRIRIENEVSERQRASFQSVVTDFLSGIAQMIAAEVQLALARRATSAISGLFSASGAAAGAGVLSGVLLPLLGRSWTCLWCIKTDWSFQSQCGGLSKIAIWLGRTDKSECDPKSRTNAGKSRNRHAYVGSDSECDGGSIWHAMGQANSRVRLKTERWGG